MRSVRTSTRCGRSATRRASSRCGCSSPPTPWASSDELWRPVEGAWTESGGLPRLDPIITGINTFILIVSSFTMVRALDAIGRGNQAGLKLWLGATILGGATFLGIQVYEYQLLMAQGLHLGSHLYGATFYACTAFHGLHVLSGGIYLSCIWIAAAGGEVGGPPVTHDPYAGGPQHVAAARPVVVEVGDDGQRRPSELGGLFWHFVDLVWIILFTIIYLF